MEAKRLLCLPEGLEVTNIDVTDGILTIGVVSTQKFSCCPLCSSAATRVHSYYTRTLADLPCAGQEVAPAGTSAQVLLYCDDMCSENFCGAHRSLH